MHMRREPRVALPLAGALLLTASLSGCLGVDNMAQFKAALGFGPEPVELLAPIARLRATPTLAAVGQAVAFSAQGSLDPQGFPLSFAWDFGDGARAEGSEATHRYRAPGTYEATLEARSAAAVGVDSMLITVTVNRPPTAQLDVLRGGAPVERALAGEALDFEAAARDPEGGPVAVRWDFGDGATALTPKATHAYERGGRYLVTLTAEDAEGLAATAERVLVVDQAFAGRGSVALLRESHAHVLDVGAAPAEVTVRAAFDALLGANGLVLVLTDAEGQEVARSASQVPPAAQGAAEVVLRAAADQLAGHRAGAWNLVVQRASGASVDYAFTAEVRY